MFVDFCWWLRCLSSKQWKPGVPICVFETSNLAVPATTFRLIVSHWIRVAGVTSTVFDGYSMSTTYSHRVTERHFDLLLCLVKRSYPMSQISSIYKPFDITSPIVYLDPQSAPKKEMSSKQDHKFGFETHQLHIQMGFMVHQAELGSHFERLLVTTEELCAGPGNLRPPGVGEDLDRMDRMCFSALGDLFSSLWWWFWTPNSWELHLQFVLLVSPCRDRAIPFVARC